jgi:hypothetical protein
MKPEDQVLCRIRELLVEELDRRVSAAEQRLPLRCVYHCDIHLDARKEVYGEPNDYNRITNDQGELVTQTLGVCRIGSEDPEVWSGTICEDALDAQRCPHFSPLVGKEELWVQFREDISDPLWVRDNLPAVEALLWVLGKPAPPSLPWWKRLWYRWVLRVEVTPPLAVEDPALLPPGLGK